MKETRKWWRAYVAHYALALHLFLTLYIASSMVEEIIGPRSAPLLFAGGSLAALIVTVWGTPRLFHSLPQLTLLGSVFAITEALLYFALAIGILEMIRPLVVVAFLLSQATYMIGLLYLDLFFETLVGANEYATGRVRGAMLATLNGAVLTAALIAPLVVHYGDYALIYLLAIVPLIVFLWAMKGISASLPSQRDWRLRTALRILLRSKPHRDAVVLQFFLRMFYAWMIIYLPLYLHRELGYSWESLALVFTLMLLPFVVLSHLVGWLADTKWGEREFLVGGFVLITITIVIVPLLGHATLVAWILLLLLSRVGAALVDAAGDAYFFKHVDNDDSSLIALFRSTRPVAFIVTSVSGGIIHLVAPMAVSFWFLASTMAFAAFYALSLRDTEPHPTSA